MADTIERYRMPNEGDFVGLESGFPDVRDPNGEYVRHEDYERDTASLRAEVEALRGALEPFAKLAARFPADFGDGTVFEIRGSVEPDGTFGWSKVTLGDCRKARALLAKGGR